jgi:MoaA/NifB/PqqE/SkfB family radical SAM enzyme
MARKMIVDVLGMIVTERCNLKCEHCLRGCRSNKVMSDDVIEATLSNFDYIETLSICGGEVTLALDVVEKIINYIIKHQILVGEITYTINGTIYSQRFLDLIDYSNGYLISDGNTKDRTSFAISWDGFHHKEIRRLGMEDKYLENVKQYSESPYYYGVRRLEQKLFREGRAELLPEDITVPLRPMEVYMTYYTKYKSKLGFIRRKFDRENGNCLMGPIITVNTEGIVTECDASLEHQRTIYNYGNIFDNTIEEICLSRNPILEKPKTFEKKLNKTLDRYFSYDK